MVMARVKVYLRIISELSLAKFLIRLYSAHTDNLFDFNGDLSV